jgi:Kef-type K+ transport system membrane component KefB
MSENILISAEFQIAILMFVALAGYLLAYGINQSAVVGIIIAGIIVGPSLLGLITYTDFVSKLAHLGAVVLLFTIGLEFEIKDIAKLKYLVIAAVGIIIPWGAGFGVAEAFNFDFKAAVFIGTATTATSIAITANVLSEMGKLNTRVAHAIMGAAIIDDVLALLALTISEQLVTDSLQSINILISLGKSIGFLVIVTIPIRILLRKVMIWFDSTKMAVKYPESIFIFAIMVAFLYSIAAEAAGLSAVVGSFLAGMTFASMELKQCRILRKGTEHLKIIFASIFFISLGVLLDIHSIDVRIIMFILALTVAAIISKVIGCGIPAKLFGYNLKESLTIGTGMIPRGEVAMIVALIGLSKNWIQQDIYSAIILMSLLTTIIPPIILRNWLLKPVKDG